MIIENVNDDLRKYSQSKCQNKWENTKRGGVIKVKI